MFLVEHKTIDGHEVISKAWPAGYAMLQFLPFVVMALSDVSAVKQMRKIDVSTIRVAELRRRTLSDYINPVLIVCAVALCVTFLLIEFYVNNPADRWSSDSVSRVVSTVLVNCFFIAIGAFSLYGPKQDPYQTQKTRAHIVSIALKTLAFSSMAISIFMAVNAINDGLSSDAYEALIISIFLQVIAVISFGYTLSKTQPRKQDFDVYREEAI